MQGLSDIVSIVGPLSCCELSSPATPCKHRLFIFESMQVYQQRACQPCLELALTFPTSRLIKIVFLYALYMFVLFYAPAQFSNPVAVSFPAQHILCLC
jgi:hypothetical protein